MDFNFYLFKEYLIQTYVEKFQRCEKVFSGISPSHSAPLSSDSSLKEVAPLQGFFVLFQRFFYYTQANSEYIYIFNENDSIQFSSAIFNLI